VSTRLNLRFALQIGAATLAFSSVAMAAGTVTLVNDNWDSICTVQVTTGINAPKGNPEVFTNVQRRWSIVRPERVCYRRTADPKVCNSGLTEWRCSGATVSSGNEKFSLR
jgi:hypothetical protein